MDEIEAAMAGLGDPRPLPSELRDRLADRLTSEPLLEGLDDPRPLPDDVRDRLFGRLTSRRRSPLVWMNVAAAVILVAALGTVAVRAVSHHGPGRSVTALQAPSNREGAAGSGLATSGGSGAGGASSAALGTAGSGGLAAGPFAASGDRNAAGGSSSLGPGGATSENGPAPPFAFASSAPAESVAGPSSPSAAPASNLPPLDVGIVAGNQAEEQGFRAYIQLLDANGGVRGRALDIVAVSPSAPARGVVATVNVSDAAVATTPGPPSWTGSAPLLETLAVPESVLHGAVFDFASAPVHQADLAVAEVFPSPSPGSTAVIFAERSGVLGTDVPNALVAALRRAAVTTVVVPYSPGAALPPADAAFLSLDTADARAWFAAAARAAYHPRLGVTGIYSIAEPSLVASMPAGTRVLSPYTLPDDAERAALDQRIGGPAGVAAVHGWLAAKALAVALWQSGETTAPQTEAALAQLRGYDDGFSPPLAYRPGTTSRTPDAILMTVSGGALVPSGQFRTDTG